MSNGEVGKMANEYIQKIDKIEQFSELVLLQKEVWGLEDIDVVPSVIFKSVTGLTGPNGIVLGYFIDDQLTGYLLTLPTSNPKEVLGCMLAVSKSYQHKGIGYKLNLKLREIMLANDVEKIFWTFDPLESVNAHLYLRKLGGIITRYFIDYYGDVNSRLHKGLSTDRAFVEWNINDLHVKEKLTNYQHDNESDQESLCSTCKEYIEIPLNIQVLKKTSPEEAIHWRERTRIFFKQIVEDRNLIGYDYVVDIHKQKGMYLFKQWI
jgi:predicted GNAT superfamily acetyltransferase